MASPVKCKAVSWVDQFADQLAYDDEERLGIDSLELTDWNDEVDSSGESSVC